MIDTPEIVTTAARPVAVIPFDVSHGEMMTAFGPGVGELMAALQAQGVAPAGPVFAHHTRMVPGRFVFELGVPVSSPVRAAGRMTPSLWPAQRAARTIHHGGYEGLPGAWKEFDAWMKGEKHPQAEDLWESYVDGPHSGPDQRRWRTELLRPLKG